MIGLIAVLRATFVQRGIGDVFISWENEAFLAVTEKAARVMVGLRAGNPWNMM
ncbi:MAG: hypothetical protein HGA73_01140, partial [Syntrophaceae bacterium]|nr:hypothetical protein [Syntrophaceae bacterium]